MAFGMFSASIPVYQRMLTALSKNLEKGSAWAAAKKVDEAVFGATRLIPDMHPLTRQVQIACRFAEESAARLSGREIPKAPENAEKTLAELRGRIDEVLGTLKGYAAADVDGRDSREVVLTVGGKPLPMTAEHYLLFFALPNFYFHVTTAYAIMRQSGVELGKRDFVGAA